MNIFNRIALQGLKKNRTRTLVTIVGVILSSLMITGVSTFGVSLLDYMARGAMAKSGTWNTAFLDADPSFMQERMQDEEVTDTVSFENIGYARLEGGTNPDKPYLFIAGFGQDAFDALHITLMTGRFPENDGEVILSARVESEGNTAYRVGDTISLSVGRRMKNERDLTQADPFASEEEIFIPRTEKTYTVVGTMRTPVFELDASPGYTMITRSNTAGSADSGSLFVTLKNPRKTYSYAEDVKGSHTCIFNTDVLRFMGISKQSSDMVFMVFLYSFGAIVLSIIMVGSIFLIYNSFSISLSERVREIGMLASVGATAKQLRNSVLFEGLCIGAVGIPIGVLAGLGCIKAVLSIVSDRFESILYDGVSLYMMVSGLAIAGAVVVSFVTILISAYIPAKKAVNMPVMECIRQTNEIKVESKSMKISRRKQRMYGLEGTLALKNFKRNKKRYRSIVLSLLLSIVLFVTTNAVILVMQDTAGGFKTVSDMDVAFGTQDMEDADLLGLYNKLKNTSGVTESSCRAAVRFSCAVRADSLTDAYWETAGERLAETTLNLPMEVDFFNDEFYQKIAEDLGLPAGEYTGQDGRFIALAKINSDSDDVKGAEDLKDVFKSDSIDLAITPKMTDETVKGQEQNVSVKFMEFIPPDIPPIISVTESDILPYTFQILAPWSMKESLVPSGMPVDIIVKGMCFDSDTPGQTTQEMRTIINAEELRVSYLLVNSAEAYESFRNYIFIANTFAYIFIALISLIAVANVFNTISTNIRLRRRELAMLRSVGMSDRDFNKMMCFECVFYGMKALVIGIPLSLLLSVLIVKTMVTDEVKFILPWGSVVISALSVFLVIFITMMYAVSKIRKENIIEALRDEMT